LAALATIDPFGGEPTMDALGPFHPQIVHTPIALLVFSALFAIAGRLFDREWVRKASVLMLVFGFLGSFAAVQSGQPAHRDPEHKQGVPEEEIHEHADAGRYTMWVAGAALVAYAAGTRTSGGLATAVAALALLLQVAAAALVGVTGLRGGELTYEYGANVKVGGVLVKNPGAGGEGHGAPSDSARTGNDEEREGEDRPRR
jgi:uncharacterized membrane protein